MIQATVDRHIIPLLGQDLYDACESYPTLFSKVEMALANLVIYDHMPRLYMRLTSTGAKTLNASNTQTSSEKDRAYLQGYYLQQANVYIELIKEEMPDYDEYDNNTYQIGYGTGIIL